MDLITEPWLPVTTFSGIRKKIAIADILDNDILDTAWPRADFQGAAWQFLIGILQCSVAPEDDRDWAGIWRKGIDPTVWRQRLQIIAPAMQFGAQKPAFLQSYEPLDAENSAISGLLIEAPGGNTLKLNKDHFVKRHLGDQICPHCAVMALFAVQTNSPAGGAGYRVGLRGGGPLTTLLVPLAEHEYPLWQKLWLNVLPDNKQPALKPEIFPWLAPTLTSEKAGNKVTPDNADRRQAYWGMPRRIELDFTQTRAGRCDLCGEQHDSLLVAMRNKNYGVQYDNWTHPLSPYRQAIKDPAGPWLALKGQPGGLNYKDWLGLTLKSEDNFNRMMPARVTSNISRYRRLPASGLWCFAWDMDNAKARCWYQHRIPLMHVENNDKFSATIQLIVLLAAAGLQVLRKYLKEGWFTAPKEAKVDFSMIDIAFWQETEPAFRTLLEALIPDSQYEKPETRAAIANWEHSLHLYLLNQFDNHFLKDPQASVDILLRQITARHKFERDYCKLKLCKNVLGLADEQKEPEMLINDTDKEIIITHPEAKKLLIEWFDILSERDAKSEGVKINGRAWRAELRRMSPPFGVMMCEGYSVLRHKLARYMPIDQLDAWALALFTSVAVHIKSHKDGLSFAAQLGLKTDDKDKVMSTLRFERLLQAEEPGEFCQQLIRAVRLRGREGVNVVSLADSIFLWMREWQQRQDHQPENPNPFARHRIRWATEYLKFSR